QALVLAAAGGAAGVMLAAWGIQALQSLAPSDVPRLTGIHIDTPVILYASLAALVTGLMFGMALALQSAAVTAGEFLKQGGRAGAGGSRSRRLRPALATRARR